MGCGIFSNGYGLFVLVHKICFAFLSNADTDRQIHRDTDGNNSTDLMMSVSR
jgi:hypothetical protein